MTEQEKSFRTADGYCRILSDKLIISKNGETVKTWRKKQRSHEIRNYVYLFLAVAMIGISILGLMRLVFYPALMVGVVGLTLGFLYFRNRKFSQVNEIPRDSIYDMQFYQTYNQGFQSSFIVHFKDETGAARKRRIILPATSSRTDIEIAEAYEIMASEFLFIRFTQD